MLNKIKEYIRQTKYIDEDKKFNDLYKKIDKEIIQIEEERKKVLVKLISIYIVFIVLAIFLIKFRTKIDEIFTSGVVMLIFVAGILVSLGKYIKFNKKYVAKYKRDILTKVIQWINNDNVYISEAGISINDYLEAGFESTKCFNEYKSRDYRKISIKDKDIHLSNIKLIKKEVTEDITVTTDGWGNTRVDKNTYETNTNIFRGIYSFVGINKNVEEIRIEKSLQNFLKNNEQVILDHQSFEKYFNIFSKNRMLVMRVLTPRVMDQMLEFINKNHIDFDIIIKANKIHFKIYSQIVEPKGYFELSINKRLENIKKYIYYYYCLFKFIINMTEYLSNTIDELDI